jgi:hypothetical protein
VILVHGKEVGALRDSTVAIDRRDVIRWNLDHALAGFESLTEIFEAMHIDHASLDARADVYEVTDSDRRRFRLRLRSGLAHPFASF